MSTTHHPQTDGASEVMNRMLENYLRRYCSYRQDDWGTLLPAAEFAYNSAVSHDLGTSPFEIDLGWKPKSPLELVTAQDTPTESVNSFKHKLKSAFEDATFCHKLAKARQSAYTVQKYRPPNYRIGDHVWIHKALLKDAVSRSQVAHK